MNFFAPKKIWQKFAYSVLFIVTFVLVIFNLIRLNGDIADSKEEIDHKLETMSSLAALSVAEPLWNIDRDTINKIGDSLFENEETVYVEIIDDKIGSIYKREIEDEIYKEYEKLTIEKAIVAREENIGKVKISFTMFERDKMIEDRIWFAIFQVVVMTAVTFILIAIVSNIVTEPIKDLMIATDNVARGNYKERLKVTSKDEIGMLTEKFNEMIDRIDKSDADIKNLNEELEMRVKERTRELFRTNEELEETLAGAEETQAELMEANNKLEKTLDKLRNTQEQLIQSGKMALLGELVAGVAHEINTPVGVSLTASSYLIQETKQIVKLYEGKKLSKKDMEEYLESMSESSMMISRNLDRAVELIKSFKQVAVDQISRERRVFLLKEYFEEIIMNLRSKFKRTKHEIIIHCEESLEIDSYPGVYSQIFTNFLINTLKHGFEGIEKGVIEIMVKVDEENNSLKIIYRDDGNGISKDNLKRIFDPFFTTKRGSGGSGLGLNIVYNLITTVLGGSIKCNSEAGTGVEFVMDLPLNLPKDIPESY